MQSGIRNPTSGILSIPVIVAALGYFVDIYDLLLFTLIRIKSLHSLGLSDDEVNSVGHSILNWQMGGLLIGGILWGILGDKKGRLSVLFGSILIYSLANIANGFAHDVTSYTICRFMPALALPVSSAPASRWYRNYCRRRSAGLPLLLWRASGLRVPWWPISFSSISNGAPVSLSAAGLG